MVMSFWSTSSIEDVAEASGSGLRWFQLTLLKDRELSLTHIQSAERAGYKALVVTIDDATLGRRLSSMRDRFTVPPTLSLPILQTASAAGASNQQFLKYAFSLVDCGKTWETLDWLCSVTKLPVVLKGILTAEDAWEAVKHNIQGIIVSNHGGRQLDGVPATVSVFLLSHLI